MAASPAWVMPVLLVAGADEDLLIWPVWLADGQNPFRFLTVDLSSNVDQAPRRTDSRSGTAM